MIFNNNTHYGIGGVNYADTIPAMEGYDCVTGCGIMLMENQYNDFALFNAGIKMDMDECRRSLNEGTVIINEGFKDIINKIVELFQSLIAKIKGILQAFGAKLLKVFHANKKLVEKYKKIINGCSDWSKFKVNKYRNPKSSADIDAVFGYDIVSDDTDGYNKALSTNNLSATLYGIQLDKVEKMSNDEITEKIIRNNLDTSISGSVDGDMKNFKKVALDALFEYESDKTNWTTAEISNIGDMLTEADKAKSVIKKYNDNLTGTISKIINKLKDAQSKISDIVSDREKGNNNNLANHYNYASIDVGVKNDKYDTKYTTYKKNDSGEIDTVEKAQTQQRVVGALLKIATNEKDVITKLTSVFMDVYKFTVAQCRKVYSSAAAYASTHKSAKNESADLIEAIGEAAYYDFMTDMDSIY